MCMAFPLPSWIKAPIEALTEQIEAIASLQYCAALIRGPKRILPLHGGAVSCCPRPLFGTAVFAAAFGLCGCALPEGAVILLSAPPSTSLAPSVQPIPADWDGRMLMAGSGPPSLGGAEAHVHGFVHQPSGMSGPPDASAPPLGLRRSSASGKHVHALVGQAQSPTTTGSAENLPPSKELLAVVMRESLFHPREGVIVGYTGSDAPLGWDPCDGTKGTPKLANLYIRLRRQAAAEQPAGSGSHSHRAVHSHTWGVAPTDPSVGTNLALNGDTYQSPSANLSVSPINHAHTAFEPAPAVGTSDTVTALPPTVAVRFLRATAAARDMPSGALLPYTEASPPMGWSSWVDCMGAPVEGRLLVGAGGDAPAICSIFGNYTHTHRIETTHHVELKADQPVRPADVRDKGPLVALSRHHHSAEIAEAVESLPASHMPPFVSLQIIRKR